MMIVVAFLFGTCIGSFLNVLIWRLPNEQSIRGRSQCPHCHHQLGGSDLIPLFSFAWNGGKCRYCKASISWRYPIIEIVTGLLFALAAAYFMPHDFATAVTALRVAVVLAVCVTVFVIDWEHYLILDRIVFPAMAIVLAILIAAAAGGGNWSMVGGHILAGVAAMAPFLLVWLASKGAWMGLGDVKFVAFMGLALGWPAVAAALLLAFGLGALVGLTLIASGRKQMSSKLPFGTFLSAATVIALFWGHSLWNGYWKLLGL